MVKPERLPYGVAFKTVRKFKGLENEVVLVVDVQYEHLARPEGQRLLYTAASRAKNVLAIFLTDPPPDTRQQKFKTEWLSSLSLSENLTVQKGLEAQLRHERYS
ncbi:MAG: ATP-binding domain-containing protein [Microscillaceae bacterium]|nr:ATP-binding domain-containing protein [Microscillaceae bacterium]